MSEGMLTLKCFGLAACEYFLGHNDTVAFQRRSASNLRNSHSSSERCIVKLESLRHTVFQMGR